MNKNIDERWLRFHPSQHTTTVRLFCFPYAGGGASFFRHWSRYFPGEIEIWPVQLPGREDRLAEPPFTEMAGLIDTLVSVLSPVLDRPYAFFGHSMGALISFELARALHKKQEVPAPIHLFLSGHRAPHLPLADSIHHLSDDALIEKIRLLQGTPEEVLQHNDLLQLLLPLLRADFQLSETYQYVSQEPLPHPISIFGGLEDTVVPPEMMKGWSQHTVHALYEHFFKGNHFYLFHESKPLLAALLHDLHWTLRLGRGT